MSSDPVDSDVVPANGNGSAKRPLDSDCKKADDLPDNQSSMNSTTDAELDVENPPKRVKVEEVEAVEENPLNPVVSNDSSSTEAPPTQTTIVKDERENGNTGANDESNSIAPTDAGTTSDTGIDADDSQTGRTSQPLNVFSPALTRSRANSKEKKTDNEGMESVKEEAAGASASTEKPSGRWRVHQMAEDYTNMVGSMMYPATQFNSYGYNPAERRYPIEKISLLRFMKSPLRRPTVMEKWNPYEIAIFEGSLLHYGKEFGTVSKQIGTKTTKEVIDFYYVWKKTAHYKKWKEQYISDEDLIEEYIPVKKPKR